MTAAPDTSIRDIVVADFRAASVFHTFDIDFCCAGDRTVADVCREKNLDAGSVLAEIEKACARPDTEAPRFEMWEAPALIEYIVERHHAYVRAALPAILAHVQRVADAHGERHPELHDVAEVMTRVAADMLVHVAREEAILFPYVERLFHAVNDDRLVRDAFFGSVVNPVSMMERDHEAAGRSMALVRELTDGYRVPEDACTTYRICLQELERFERDLHTHVHLENNILFPAALDLETRLRRPPA